MLTTSRKAVRMCKMCAPVRAYAAHSCSGVAARMCVPHLLPACERKDVSCSDLNTIPRDKFFKINVLSAVSVSSTVAVWHASLTHVSSADRSAWQWTSADARIADTRGYLRCLARRHVCPSSSRVSVSVAEETVFTNATRLPMRFLRNWRHDADVTWRVTGADEFH